MSKDKEFWASLRQKYEDKNRLLLQKEQELRFKLDCMEAAIGDAEKTKKLVQNSAMPAYNTLPSIIENPGFNIKECNCVSEKRGFLNSVYEFLRFGNKEEKKKSADQKLDSAEISKGSGFDKVSFTNQSKKLEDTSALDEDNSICFTENSKKEEKTNVCQCLTCGETTKTCACNLEDFEKSSTRKVPLKHKVYSGSLCASSLKDLHPKNFSTSEAMKKHFPIEKADQASLKSLQSIDLQYIQNIQDLATQQKVLLKEITHLEQKEKIFDSVINKQSKENGKETPLPTNCGLPKKNHAELLLENALLKNELKDMRLEVRQYLEKMEGPMQYKIESERYKCHQLEQKLEETVKEQHNLQNFYQKELDTIKMQLYCANTRIYNLLEENKKLKQNLADLEKKCQDQNADLIRLKISEGEALKKMQNLMLYGQPVQEETHQECNLYEIARELSKILKDCEPCGLCMNLPEDLTEAAKLLKNLSDLVDERLATYIENKPMQDEKLENLSEALKESKKEEDTKMCICPECPFLVEDLDSLEELKPRVVDTPKAEKLDTTESKKEDEDTKSCICPECPFLLQALDSSEKLKPRVADTLVTGSEAEKLHMLSDHICMCPECPFLVEDLDSLEKLKPRIADTVVTESEAEKLKTTGNGSLSKLEPEEKSQMCVCAVCPISEVFPSTLIEPPRIVSVDTTPLCRCVQTKRTREVDQLWPATNRPVSLKEYSEENIKKPCSCSVAKTMRVAKNKNSALENVEFPTSSTVVGKIDEKLPESLDIVKTYTRSEALAFPFEIDTQVDIINKPPEGIQVTTSITNSGTLEVITEGPEGTIETTLVYTSSGNVQVVTEMHNYKGFDSSENNLKAILAQEIEEIKSKSEDIFANGGKDIFAKLQDVEVTE